MCALGARASRIELAYLATAVHVCPECAGVSPRPWWLTVSASCTPWVRGRLARSRPEIAGIAA
ncbi:hypothetical protein [Roseiflexus sp.]